MGQDSRYPLAEKLCYALVNSVAARNWPEVSG